MSSPDATYHFDAPVLRTEQGTIRHYLPIPDEIGSALRDAGVRRVIAVLNGREFRRALIGRGDGSRCVVLGHEVLQSIGASDGEMVSVGIYADPDPDRVDIPEEFAAVLEQDPEAMERFSSMTPGMQRSLALHVSSAKREQTRIARALDLARKLRTRTLYGDRGENE